MTYNDLNGAQPPVLRASAIPGNMPIDPHIMGSVPHMTVRTSVPVLLNRAAYLDTIGTGTFFGVAGRTFLVTAKHLFEDTDPGELAVPLRPIASKTVQRLGPASVYLPSIEGLDIAVVELLDAITVAEINTHWRVLGLSALAAPTETGTFVLSGYPSARAKPDGDNLAGSLLTFYTHRLPFIPEGVGGPVRPGIDLFFAYGSEGIDPSGKTMTAPHLGGTSGAAIWEYTDLPSGRLWTADTAMQMVGVQSAFLEGSHCHATCAEVILDILSRVDPVLAGAVEAHRAKRQELTN